MASRHALRGPNTSTSRASSAGEYERSAGSNRRWHSRTPPRTSSVAVAFLTASIKRMAAAPSLAKDRSALMTRNSSSGMGARVRPESLEKRLDRVSRFGAARPADPGRPQHSGEAKTLVDRDGEHALRRKT